MLTVDHPRTEYNQTGPLKKGRDRTKSNKPKVASASTSSLGTKPRRVSAKKAAPAGKMGQGAFSNRQAVQKMIDELRIEQKSRESPIRGKRDYQFQS